MLDLNLLTAKIETHCLEIGVFDAVYTEAPDNVSASGVLASIIVEETSPATAQSGLAATSELVDFTVRVWKNVSVKPNFGVNLETMQAVETLINSLHTDLDLESEALTVDVLGIASTGVTSRSGYVPFSEGLYRVVDVRIPVIVADVWTQQYE